MVWRIFAHKVTFDFVAMTQHPTCSEDAFVVNRRSQPRAMSCMSATYETSGPVPQVRLPKYVVKKWRHVERKRRVKM